MRITASIPAISLLFATSAFAQIDHTFHIDNTPSPQGFQALATILRTVGDIKQLTVDAPASAISVSGTAADIALAEWIIRELDQPAAGQPIRETSAHQYFIPGAKDDVVRMFYLSNINTTQGEQELLTVLRTVENVQKTYNYPPLKAIAVRGTPELTSVVAWTIQELDHAPGAQTPGTHEFLSLDRWVPVVRVFYLQNHTVKDLQETLTALRSKPVFIRYAFNFTSRGAMIVGGTAAEIETAAQLIEQRDQVAAK